MGAGARRVGRAAFGALCPGAASNRVAPEPPPTRPAARPPKSGTMQPGTSIHSAPRTMTSKRLLFSPSGLMLLAILAGAGFGWLTPAHALKLRAIGDYFVDA